MRVGNGSKVNGRNASLNSLTGFCGVLTFVIGIAVILLGVSILFALVCLPHLIRTMPVRHAYKDLPSGVAEKVIQLIECEKTAEPGVTFLKRSDGVPLDEELFVVSRVGGSPYMEPGDENPQKDIDKPETFLLQVRIDEPALGDAWQGRLLAVFQTRKFELVKSYESPSLDQYTRADFESAPICYPLRHIHAPREILNPKQLCENIPAIKEVLRPYTNDFAGLLTQILRPNHHHDSFEPQDLAYIGYEPMLIQPPLHEPHCDRCDQPMRFLFQFGEIIPARRMADAGICYVYGCDNHPEQCEAFVQSH